MSVRKLSLLLLLMAASLPGWSQLQLGSLPASGPPPATARTTPLSLKQLADTLQLPFFDDFSGNRLAPDSSRWPNNSTVAQTLGYAINPPSRGVATLDGLNLLGNPHVPNATVGFISDSLVSAPIDLSGQSNADGETTLFYFQWQIAGLGDRPDSFDSLQLYFLDDQAHWRQVWRVGNSPELDTAQFYPLSLNLDDIQSASAHNFFHAGFRFKFQNKAKPTGPFDLWHIDYVFLGNREDQGTDLSFDDRSFVQLDEPLLLQQYTALPLSQFLAEPRRFLAPDYTLSFRSLKQEGVTDFMSYSFRLTDNQGNTLAEDPEIFVSQPANELYQQTDPLPTLSLPSYELNEDDTLVLTSTLTLTKTDQPAQSFRNDTVRVSTILADYYAYDDGSAERAVYLRGTQNRLAIQFELSRRDTLSALDFYFPYYGASSTGRLIDLKVWRSLGQNGGADELLYEQKNASVIQGGLNQFTRFNLNRLLILEPGTFYVGYEQQSPDQIAIGLDRNTNSMEQVFESDNGISWQPTRINVEGSLMIRPVFGQIIFDPTGFQDKLGPRSQVYPNPGRAQLNLYSAAERVRLLSATGQLLASYPLTGDVRSGQQLNIQNLKPGLYLLQFIFKDSSRTQRFLKH